MYLKRRQQVKTNNEWKEIIKQRNADYIKNRDFESLACTEEEIVRDRIGEENEIPEDIEDLFDQATVCVRMLERIEEQLPSINTPEDEWSRSDYKCEEAMWDQTDEMICYLAKAHTLANNQ